MRIGFHVTVLRAQDGGYLARADELALFSEPFPRQASAVANLKEKLRAFLREEAEQGTLTKRLGEIGFMGGIGEDFIYIDPADSLRVTLPLPRNRNPGEERRKGMHGVR